MTGGRFITLEGGEGAGKSTQTRLLANALASKGLQTITTREPGGTPGAEDIRDLLVQGEVGRWDPMSEALLHFAARRNHVSNVIDPALEAGQWVVCDRFTDSTIAYQGFGLGLGKTAIEALHRLAIGDLWPDLTVILDIPFSEGFERIAARSGDSHRYERMDDAFHERLRAGFLDIAKSEPQRCAVVDARDSIEGVHAAVLAIVEQRLEV